MIATVGGSIAVRKNGAPCNVRAAVTAVMMPIVKPASDYRSVDPASADTTSPVCAPTARRTATSFVRRDGRYVTIM
jgi:hypothetical protein